MRLYPHALESIFAMLQLHDLAQILAVSRSWAAAVRSMKAIGAPIERDEWQIKRAGKVFRPLPPIVRLVASPLVMHLATMILLPDPKHPLSAPLTREELALLAQHAPNLTSLRCTVLLTPRAPWILPRKLTSLQFGFWTPLPAADTNELFIRMSALPALDRLHLNIPDDSSADGVDFSLLAASPSLKDLTFRCDFGAPQLSDDQVHQIRMTLGHLRRVSVARMDADALARFLQPPVTARWQDIDLVCLDARSEGLLARLPSLTKLDLLFDQGRPNADFLSQLPQLKDLTLNTNKFNGKLGFHVAPAAMLHSLLPCTGIIKLQLHCGFNSAQLTVLFAQLTALTQLTIIGDLDSFQCFSSGPITQTLEELRIVGFGLPPSWVARLYALQRLRSLALDFDSSLPLDAATIDSLSPPTPLFPMLTAFLWQWEDAQGRRDRVERKGMSFSWTQQRLTQ